MPGKRKMPAPPAIPVRVVNARDAAREDQITRDLQTMVVRLRQRALDNAVLLAQQAACGRGPLVEHFVELGRRYHNELNKPQKPALRVVPGGIA